jgi:DNA-binding response OmpR family regulator
MQEYNPILLAENDDNDLALTLQALSEQSLANKVVVVRDGTEVLDYLFRRRKFQNRPEGNPAVVLLDTKMPKVGGLEVLRNMRSNPELKKVPVVMLTSSREEKNLVESYELGAISYVVKPFELQELLDSVKKLGFSWALLKESPRDVPVG